MLEFPRSVGTVTLLGVKTTHEFCKKMAMSTGIMACHVSHTTRNPPKIEVAKKQLKVGFGGKSRL